MTWNYSTKHTYKLGNLVLYAVNLSRELTLNETGLTQKGGGRILDHVFELEWTKHGGVPYVWTQDFTK